MTNQNNKRLIEQYVQAWTKADVATLEKIVGEGFRYSNPPPGFGADKEGQIKMAKTYNKAFPDMDARVVKTVAEGNEVVALVRGSGTHRGEFMGVPASDQRIEIEVLVMCTIRDGKIVEDVTQFDTLALMTQIGAVPEMGTMTH